MGDNGHPGSRLRRRHHRPRIARAVPSSAENAALGQPDQLIQLGAGERHARAPGVLPCAILRLLHRKSSCNIACGSPHQTPIHPLARARAEATNIERERVFLSFLMCRAFVGLTFTALIPLQPVLYTCGSVAAMRHSPNEKPLRQWQENEHGRHIYGSNIQEVPGRRQRRLSGFTYTL